MTDKSRLTRPRRGLLLAVLFLPSGAWKGSARAGDFEDHVAPFIAKHCAACHNPEKKKGDLVLDAYRDLKGALEVPMIWEKVRARLLSREMPPTNRPRPSQPEVDAIVPWLESAITGGRPGKKDPGRVTMRRLNRTEYNNTIRDLLAVDFQPADDFPSDDVGYGFDNIGDVLSLPPILLEKYLAAAEKIAGKVLRRIMICEPAGPEKRVCLEKILERLATRAYRRPATRGEVIRLSGLVERTEADGGSVEDGLRLALEAVLVSPHFLFRIETDPEPSNPNAAHPVNDFELAARLSYFLWSSLPDDELFDLACGGALRKNGTLEAQALRMLRHSKARALTENFCGQWLTIRNLATVTPDKGRFPAFDDALRAAMLMETELFFEAVVKEDRSVLDFIDGDFTFLDERLAKHYGYPGVVGSDFRRVPLTGGRRGGVLTQASVLTVTSNPMRTSPVKRGKWVLEQFLGAPPPPPPPGAGELKEGDQAELQGTLRERMEQHRADPLCASCHSKMDPLGFGLENFDAIGAWRDQEGRFPVDASGTLPDGRTFEGPAGLKAILKAQEVQFTRALAEKMLTFALGRGLEYYDRRAVDEITTAVRAQEHKFSSLVLAVVKSEPFQMRRGERSTEVK